VLATFHTHTYLCKKQTLQDVVNPNMSLMNFGILVVAVHMLGGLLACVPAHSDVAADLVHPALPAVKLILDWLTTNHTVLNRKEVALSSR